MSMNVQILEHENVCKVIPEIEENDSVLLHIKNKCLTENNIVVSLSGGVDSMVILCILKHLKKKVIAFHINYNNRKESFLEANFLKKWCEDNSILLELISIDHIHRNDTKREEYENKTRLIRFSEYKRICVIHGAKMVCLGHHDDDIIENVLNNLLNGRSLLDLTVMREVSEIHSVLLFRPLIGLRKQHIFDFAHKYRIPYFLNTTPEWSIRGILRNDVIKSLRKISNNVEQHMLTISKQSDEWNDVILNHIVKPFLDSMTFTDDTIAFSYAAHVHLPPTFWSFVLTHLFHMHHKASPSSKCIHNFVDKLKLRKRQKFQLSLNVFALINIETVKIVFL